MTSTRHKFFLFFLVLIFSSTLHAQENFSDDLKSFQWKSPSDRESYAGLTWNYLRMPVYRGLAPKGPMEIISECAGYDKTKGPYLRQRGGKCNYSDWLQVGKGGKVTRIDTVEKLKTTYGPVNNEAKAASFVGLTQEIERTREGEIISVSVLKIPDAYLVQGRLYPPFGCTDIDTREAIFKISSSGEIEQVASKEKKGREICRD